MSSSKKAVVVAIIDSGIDTSKSDLSQYVKCSTGFRINDEGYIIEDKEMEVKHQHGTIIAMIIRHICPNVEFISVNILNEKLVTDGRILIHAVEQTLIYKPDIIHMSLGTTKWRYKFPLKQLMKMASKDNILVVSAANNEGLKSYPAYLKGVIGVKAGSFDNNYEFSYDDKFFFAPFHTEGIYGVGEVIKTNSGGGTSYSAAYITGHAANVLSRENKSRVGDVIQVLKIHKVGVI